jgi:hypothetical protein
VHLPNFALNAAIVLKKARQRLPTQCHQTTRTSNGDDLEAILTTHIMYPANAEQIRDLSNPIKSYQNDAIAIILCESRARKRYFSFVEIATIMYQFVGAVHL